MPIRIVFSMVVLTAASAAGGAESGAIAYPTVAAALQALKSDPSAHLEVHKGWTIASSTQEGHLVMWSFTPAGHPAYPSAVKRTVVEKDGSLSIGTKILCESTQAACDQLAEDFNKLIGQVKRKDTRGGAHEGRQTHRA